MRQLVDHVALEYAGWYYSNLTLAPGHPDPIEATAAALPPKPHDFSDLLEYLERNASRFANRARDVDLDRDVWIFDSVGPARFWLRQTIIEAALHSWDAAMALGHPTPLSTKICLEVIDQICANSYHRGHWWTPPSAPFGLVATDAGMSWYLHEAGGRGHDETGDGEKAAARASAPAESLLLWLADRHTPAGVTIIGDPAIAQEWRPNWAG